MPTTYPLDLTGASPTNLITNEVHTFATANDRIFPLAAGPFFTIGLKLYHGTTNELLAPVTQYKALHLHRAGSLVSGKEVCAIIIVEDATVPAVRIEYQCIGGIYSNEATLLHDLIANNPLPDGSVIWGQIFGTPVQFPPVEHLHHIDNIYGAEEIVAVLERLRIAIAAGDSPSIAAVYQHIHTLLANSNYVTEQQVIDLLSNTAVPWQLKADLHGSATEVFNLKSDPIVGVAPTEGINAAYLAVQFAALWNRLTINGIDADLAATNNATGLDLNNLQFRVPGEWYFTHAINAVKLNTPGILIVRKAGNKVYQHIILETGQEGNRHFNGIAWVPWSVSAGSGVTSIPVSSYGDLNDYRTEGFFNFKTSDNLGHAPPTQGIESDFTLQVVGTPDKFVQIARNLTTNTNYARLLLIFSNINSTFIGDWAITAPIDHIVLNGDSLNIVAEGTYLCKVPSVANLSPYGINTGGYAVLRVMTSNVTQSVVQAYQWLEPDPTSTQQDRIAVRSMVSDGVNSPSFSAWHILKRLNFYSLHDEVQVEAWLDIRFSNSISFVLNSVEITDALSNYDLDKLRHVVDMLNNTTVNSVNMGYYFTHSDNILNTPPALNDESYFFFLLTYAFEGYSIQPVGSKPSTTNGQWMLQVIYQFLYEGAISAVYIRVAHVDDWAAGNAPPWELL